MHSKVLNSLLIKPAGPDCNLACEYCFYLKKADCFQETPVHRMNDVVLEAMTRQVLSGAAGEVSFGWQGGEPTLMGLEFFERAVALQKQHAGPRRVANSLQTNGLLIDNAWVNFLKTNHFLVGLSLDGPAHIHNHYRRRRDGSGSWEAVEAAARCLLKAGVEVNALVVVNDHSVNYAEEIYNYHKALGLSWMQFIPCVEPAADNPGEPAPHSVSGEAYGQFLKILFDLWWDDLEGLTPHTHLRFFDALLHHYVSVPPPMCTMTQECGEYLVVEHDGSVYPCDFFVESGRRLGNVLEDELQAIFESSAQESFGRAKGRRHEKCQSCRWLRHCWGGCPKDRLGQEERPLSHLCEGYEMFFEYAHERMSQLAQRFMAREHGPVQQSVKRNDPCPCGSGKKYKQCCGR